MTDRPFTSAALAERWGCSAETVRRLLKAGRLRGFRVGRKFRIPASAVVDFERGDTHARPSRGDQSSPEASLMAHFGVALVHSPERKTRGDAAS